MSKTILKLIQDIKKDLEKIKTPEDKNKTDIINF